MARGWSHAVGALWDRRAGGVRLAAHVLVFVLVPEDARADPQRRRAVGEGVMDPQHQGGTAGRELLHEVNRPERTLAVQAGPHQPGHDVSEALVVDRAAERQLEHVARDVEALVIDPRGLGERRRRDVEPAPQPRRPVETSGDLRPELVQREFGTVRREPDHLAGMARHDRPLEREDARVLGREPVDSRGHRLDYLVSSRASCPAARTARERAAGTSGS